MKLAFENTIDPNRINELAKHADNEIHIRGYHHSCDVPVDFRNTSLPFNEIPIKYCPTDRYSYLHKYKPDVRRRSSWATLQGHILDDLYSNFVDKLSKYLNTAKLDSVNIISGLQEFNDKFLSDSRSKIHRERDNLMNRPNDSDVKNLERLIEKTLRYETELASALLDYKISVIESLHIETISTMLFPIVIKPSYTVRSFGISSTAQPDFLFDNKIIIDIKSPPWNDDYFYTLGGYALIHERNTMQSMDLGMIITPEYHKNRNVPHLFRSEIILIDDRYRKEFLLRRDVLLEKIKQSVDPGVPKTDAKCSSCGYYSYCWPKP